MVQEGRFLTDLGAPVPGGPSLVAGLGDLVLSLGPLVPILGIPISGVSSPRVGLGILNGGDLVSLHYSLWICHTQCLA